MPELPEVETTLRGVEPHLVGHEIVEVDVRERRLRWPVPPAIDGLSGNVVRSARRRGKYLLFEVAGGTMILHLGMSGGLRVLDPDVPWKKHDHAALRLDSGKELRYHDPRRFGCILFCEGDPEQHPLLESLGPEPLGDGFSVDYLASAARGRKLAIKQLIMDSHVVVGVGNIYACEALFLAGIHPARAAGKISKPRLERLVGAIKTVLAAAIESGGTTLRDFLNEDGQPGYFKQSLHVYGREDEPCRTCGALVKRVVQGQRSTFYCGRCQR
ncbi:MAG: bifunctional DNA-formamidopyrimidine glycosylase/DNA-(apurinic or apyrimidinic site) lyase [Verrucomicrobiales bacterium]